MKLVKGLARIVAVLALGSPSIAPGAIGDIMTVAGGGAGDGGPASAASIRAPQGVAVDTDGNLYIADGRNHRIRKVTPSGIITTVAGSGGWGFDGDGGPATRALLDNPAAVAVDGAGNLYFVDSGNVRVRKVDVNGVITTVAGNGARGYSGDGGPADAASLNDPTGIAVPPSGEFLVADALDHRVRKVANGIISTVAGNGQPPSCLDCPVDEGVAAIAASVRPMAIAFDGATGFYVITGDRVRHVNGAGTITTVAGNGGVCFNGCPLGDGGPALAASFYGARALARDAAGALYVADMANHRIRKVAAGIVTTVAGNGTSAFSGDGGPATAAGVGSPNGVAAGAAGVFFIAETFGDRIRRVDSVGTISTMAGVGPEQWPAVPFKGNGLQATDARLHQVGRAATDANGDLLVPDDGTVRRIHSATGIIDPEPAVGGHELTRDLAGNLYWIDGNRVMRRTPGGAVAAVAGNGLEGDPTEGAPAVLSPLRPLHIALDAAGTLYIGQWLHRILKIDADGRVRYFAGNGSATYSGDGGPAMDAGI